MKRKAKAAGVCAQKVSGIWYAWMYHTPHLICPAKLRADAVRAAYRTVHRGIGGEQHTDREVNRLLKYPHPNKHRWAELVGRSRQQAVPWEQVKQDLQLIDPDKQSALGAAGYVFGDAEDFLGLTAEEITIIEQRYT